LSDKSNAELPDDPVPEDVPASFRIAMEHMRRIDEVARMHERVSAALSNYPMIPTDLVRNSAVATAQSSISSKLADWPAIKSPLLDSMLLTEQLKRLATPLVPPDFANLLVGENLKRMQTIAEDTMRNFKEMIAASMPDGNNFVQLLGSQVSRSGIDTFVLNDAFQAQANVLHKYVEDIIRPNLVDVAQVISNSLTALQVAQDIADRYGVPVEETPTLEWNVQEFADAIIGYLQEDQRVLFAFYVLVAYVQLMQLSANATWQGALSITASFVFTEGMKRRTPQD
jgi:hypothetical protein